MRPETRAEAIRLQQEKAAALHPGPAQPTLGKIGTDAYGNDQMGWINPRTQTVTPGGIRNGQQITQSAQGAETGAPGNPDLHGEDYLKTLPDPNYAAQVKRIADGLDTIPPRVEGTPYGRQLKLAIVQYDPTFDTSDYSSRAKARANFTSGKNADIANKLNTAVLHLSELSDDAQKLNNWPSGSFGPLTSTVNNLRTSYREGEQDPAISNFKNTAGKVAEELTQAYRGAGGAEADIKREMDNLQRRAVAEAGEPGDSQDGHSHARQDRRSAIRIRASHGPRRSSASDDEARNARYSRQACDAGQSAKTTGSEALPLNEWAATRIGCGNAGNRRPRPIINKQTANGWSSRAANGFQSNERLTSIPEALNLKRLRRTHFRRCPPVLSSRQANNRRRSNEAQGQPFQAFRSSGTIRFSPWARPR